MDVDEQIEIMEGQINSDSANFNTAEKILYLQTFFAGDPEYSQEAWDAVYANISKSLKEKPDGQSR